MCSSRLTVTRDLMTAASWWNIVTATDKSKALLIPLQTKDIFIFCRRFLFCSWRRFSIPIGFSFQIEPSKRTYVSSFHVQGVQSSFTHARRIEESFRCHFATFSEAEIEMSGEGRGCTVRIYRYISMICLTPIVAGLESDAPSL